MVFMKRGAAAGGKTLVHRTVDCLPRELIGAAALPKAMNGTDNLLAAIGNGYDTAQVNGNASAKSGVWVATGYRFDVSAVPDDACNVTVQCKVKCGRADAENGSLTLIPDYGFAFPESLNKSYDVSSASTVVTFTRVPILPSYGNHETPKSVLGSVWLRVNVGNPGGHIDGATLTVEYDVYE